MTIDEARTSFSLLDEGWIPCLMTDGSTRELGLLEVFVEAPRVRDIVGELPTQTFAITRLLLAILHQALGEGFEGDRDWAVLWQEGLPVEAVREYLEEFRDRFDLLHPSTPFFQVAGLRTAKNEVKGVATLLFDVPPNFRLFTSRAGAALESLSFSEAARWVVHAHAYDISGIKSGLIGDPRVKGGRGYPIGVGFAGNLGGVLVEGENYAQTLLLNLVPRTDAGVAADVPPWEREPDTAAPRASEVPRGAVDLMTWQTRRIRLVHDGQRVTGCVFGNGDKITPQNLHRYETMTAWRYSKPQTAKNGGVPVFMPKEHQSERAFWRGISGLMVERVSQGAANAAPPDFAPPGLEWLIGLVEAGLLAPSQRIAPRAIGVVYGPQQSVVSDVLDERLSMPLAVLNTEQYTTLSGGVKAAVAAAEGAVNALGSLAANLASAAGGETSGPRSRALEQGFSALNLPFHRWLEGLSIEEDVETQVDAWKAQARVHVQALGEAQLAAAGPAAWKGRSVVQLKGERWISSARAVQWFTDEVKRVLAPLGAGSTNGNSKAEEPDDE